MHQTYLLFCFLETTEPDICQFLFCDQSWNFYRRNKNEWLRRGEFSEIEEFNISKKKFQVNNISYDPLYRYSQFYTLLTSIFSVFPLLYLIIFKLRVCTFNDNIKFLYIVYFTQILISVLNNCVVFVSLKCCWNIFRDQCVLNFLK